MIAVPAVELVDLKVNFGSIRAVNGLSFSAELGEVVSVLGPNGAGKTTTIETLEGYRRPSSGSARVMGLDPVSDRRALAPMIGVMLQSGGIYPSMNSGEALRLFASYFPDPAPVSDIAAKLGIDNFARTPYRRLSGGEQRRISLALALVGRPKVAFLDEPTSGMDIEGRLAVRQVVSELRDSGVCVIIATHELSEAERFSDRVIIVDQGNLVAQGPPRDLIDESGTESLEDLFLAVTRREASDRDRREKPERDRRYKPGTGRREKPEKARRDTKGKNQ